jgi:hypothetical protein
MPEPIPMRACAAQMRRIMTSVDLISAAAVWPGLSCISRAERAVMMDVICCSNLIGRNYLWNNAFQYRAFKKLWPEVELNSTFIQDGQNDGKKQTFVTPGLVIGRLPLAERAGLTIGGGFQIAARTTTLPTTTEF